MCIRCLKGTKLYSCSRNFIWSKCDGVKTSMTSDFDKDDTPSPIFDPDIYRSLVGNLMYLSQWSRLDIAIACNLLSTATSQPTQRHWPAAK